MTDTVIRTATRGPMVSGIAIGFTVASAFILLLRFYTRLVLLRNAGKDDWTILLASVSVNKVYGSISPLITAETGLLHRCYHRDLLR